MHLGRIVLASLALSLTNSVLAQTPAPTGRSESNLNNPGSVKSNAEKRDEAVTGVRGTSAPAAPGTVTSSGAGSTMSAPTTTLPGAAPAR
jgi:hypothetical protein